MFVDLESMPYARFFHVVTIPTVYPRLQPLALTGTVLQSVSLLPLLAQTLPQNACSAFLSPLSASFAHF